MKYLPVAVALLALACSCVVRDQQAPLPQPPAAQPQQGQGQGPPGSHLAPPAGQNTNAFPQDPNASALPDAPQPPPAAPAPPPTTPIQVDPMRVLEAQIVDATNELRKNPRAFARHLRTFRSYHKDGYIHYPGREVLVITQEGVAAVDEAIRVASKSSPARQVRVSRGLTRAAREHAAEIGAAGHIEHRSADGRQPHHRMERYGRISGYSAENIGTGEGTGLDMVVGLFVDDGVPSRGHRTNLLTKAYTRIGVGCAKHSRYRIVCVMDLAEGYTER